MPQPIMSPAPKWCGIAVGTATTGITAGIGIIDIIVTGVNRAFAPTAGAR